MKRLLVSCAVIVGCGLACVSHESQQHVAMAKLIPRPQSRTTFRRPPPNTRSRVSPAEVAAWYPRGRKISRRWKNIVIHHSATVRGGAKLFDKHHRQKNGWDELGYHFVIGNGTDTPNGLVEVGPRWHKQKHGAHCKTSDNYFNEHGIGICLVGDFTKTRPTRAQLASLDRLLRFLGQHCGIGPRGVITHRDVTGRTACPGNGFRLAEVRMALAHGNSATMLP